MKECTAMRALDCECGQHLEAGSDEGLFEQARAHVDRDHPEMRLSDEQVREIVSGGAYDK
jgi:predicted small metal-binding protein